jgi:hypothetical protein
MKKIIAIFLLLFIAAMLIGCESEDNVEADDDDDVVADDDDDTVEEDTGALSTEGLEEYTTDLTEMDTDLEELDW